MFTDILSAYHVVGSTEGLLPLVLLPSVLWYCWLGSRKGIRPVKKGGDGGGGYWLVRIEWHPAGWSMCLPLFIFPCTIKSRSSLLALAHAGGLRKRAVKRLWCGTRWLNF